MTLIQTHAICFNPRVARARDASWAFIFSQTDARLFQDHNLKRSIAAEHVHSYVAFIVSGEQKINSRISYF